MGIKSRGNWALGSGVSQEKWDKIFEKKSLTKRLIDKLRGTPKK